MLQSPGENRIFQHFLWPLNKMMIDRWINKSRLLSVLVISSHICTILVLVFSQAVERLVRGADSGCPAEKERQTVLNCTRLLTRILPYIFEDADWRGFFWSTIPGRAGVRRWHLLMYSSTWLFLVLPILAISFIPSKNTKYLQLYCHIWNDDIYIFCRY